jgi:hypothetical protein
MTAQEAEVFKTLLDQLQSSAGFLHKLSMELVQQITDIKESMGKAREQVTKL